MRFYITILKTFFVLLIICSAFQLQSQVTLGTSPYKEDFDGIGSGYPTGWTGRTGASATDLGTTQTLTIAKIAWAETTGAFKNLASADGLMSNSSPSDQSNSTDRSFGVRQSKAFGDPGASFTLQLANTTNISNLQLSFKLQSLDISSARVTTWKLEYGLGANPTSFTDITTMGTMTTGGSTFTNVTITANLPAAIENQSQEVWLRIVTLTGTTGSGNRPSTGIDDFRIDFQSGGNMNSTNSDIIYNPSFSPASNVDYTQYIANDVTDVNSLQIGQFIIQDGGGVADGDALSTTLTTLTLALDKSANIDRIAIYDGTSEILELPAGAAVAFTGLNLVAPDGGSMTFAVRVTFKSTVTDNDQISAQITAASADPGGSGFAMGNAGGAQTSIAFDDNRIEVTATRLDFVQNVTSPTAKGANMTPAPTVSADDINGNRDLDFVGSVNIISTGSLVGTSVTSVAVAGLATFATIKHDMVGTNLVLTATSTGLTTVTSSFFDIILTSLATDYFRSKATGDWVAASSWESSSDGITWQGATLYPTDVSAGIQIRTGDNITKLTGSLDVDQITIDAGGTLTLNGGNFYLKNGSGDDLIINGTLVNTSGNFYPATSSNVLVSSTGVYQHNRNGGTVITATWDIGSTCEIIGAKTAAPNSGLNQVFGNFSWNSLVQSQTINIGLGVNLTFINGNFWIRSTSGYILRLGSNSNFTLNVLGDFKNDAPFEMGTSTLFDYIIKVGGDLTSSSTIGNDGNTTKAKFVMNGAQSQTIAVSNGFGNKVALEIDNSFAGIGVNLTDNFNSTEKLILTQGKLALGNYNLTVNTTITGGSATAYVVTDGSGRLIRSVNSTSNYLFPVGSSTTYQPASLTFATAPAVNTVAAGFISADPGFGGLPLDDGPDHLNQIGRTGYWELNSSITQFYTATFTANNFPDIIDYSKLHLLKRDLPGGWFLDGTHILTSGSNASAVLSRNGMSGFSQFAVGGLDKVALPVRFISFTGKTQTLGNQLSWVVADEVNNKGFEIERGTRLGDFKTIGFVASGSDISARENQYSYLDAVASVAGNYYRLKQIDVNGAYVYSNIIYLKGSNSKISVYPTLTTDFLIITGTESGNHGAIYDLQGKKWGDFNLNGDETKVDLSRLPSGVYIIQVYGTQNESFRVSKY